MSFVTASLPEFIDSTKLAAPRSLPGFTALSCVRSTPLSKCEKGLQRCKMKQSRFAQGDQDLVLEKEGPQIFGSEVLLGSAVVLLLAHFAQKKVQF